VKLTDATSRLFYSVYVEKDTTRLDIKKQKGNEIDPVENKELKDLSYSDVTIIF
jgi:hypothetical protein